MVRTRSDHIVLWPSYFDSRKSREEGRRVAKNKSIDKPTAEEIYKVVKSLGMEVSLRPDKSYPGNWWEKEGSVHVEKRLSKTKLIDQVATGLKEKEHNRTHK